MINWYWKLSPTLIGNKFVLIIIFKEVKLYFIVDLNLYLKCK